MTAFSHLDGSEDWYNTLGYGYNRPEDFKSDQNSGEFRNTTIKVADIDRAELILYRHVGCGGVWVRVLWKYTLVEGESRGSTSHHNELETGHARPSDSRYGVREHQGTGCRRRGPVRRLGHEHGLVSVGGRLGEDAARCLRRDAPLHLRVV
jgi:hypothetical protein